MTNPRPRIFLLAGILLMLLLAAGCRGQATPAPQTPVAQPAGGQILPATPHGPTAQARTATSPAATPLPTTTPAPAGAAAEPVSPLATPEAEAGQLPAAPDASGASPLATPAGNGAALQGAAPVEPSPAVTPTLSAAPTEAPTEVLPTAEATAGPAPQLPTPSAGLGDRKAGGAITDWQRVEVPEAGLSLEVPRDWVRQGSDWAWAPPNVSGTSVGVLWANVTDGWQETSMLPNHSQVVEKREIDLKWAPATSYVLQVTDPAVQGGGPASLEKHVIARIGNNRAVDLYERAPGSADFALLDPVFTHGLRTAQLTGQ